MFCPPFRASAHRSSASGMYVCFYALMQCSQYEEKLKTIQSNTNAVSPAERQQVCTSHSRFVMSSVAQKK